MDKIDYKKEYKDLYQPTAKPSIIDIPEMLFITVEGTGNPNTSASYQEALEILYGLSFTIKMSKMNGTQPEGYFEYVVPPLEGLWYVEETAFDGINVTDKNRFRRISMIRQPEFVTEAVFEKARETLAKKKPKLNISRAKFVHMTEGLCVQAMHKGPMMMKFGNHRKNETFRERKRICRGLFGYTVSSRNLSIRPKKMCSTTSKNGNPASGKSVVKQNEVSLLYLSLLSSIILIYL